MKATSLVCAGAWFLLLSLPAVAENIRFQFDAYQKLGDSMLGKERPPIVYTEDKSPVYLLMRFVVDGVSETEWTEALEVINTRRKDMPKTVAAWYDQFRAQGEASCPSEWVTLEESAKSLAFERKSLACPPHEAQHAVYKVLYGKKQAFTLIATRKGGMDDETRAGWIKVMDTATIE